MKRATVHSLYSGELPNDKPILVPDSVYTVSFVNHITWLYMGRFPKIVVTFAIQDIGDFYLGHLNGYYNAKRLQGKPKKGGQFSVSWKSDFMLDYSTCFATPLRNDRINMCRFKNVLVQVRTRTVTRNRTQRKYPEGMRYSVIDRLEGVMR